MSAVQNGATVITYAEVKRLLFDDSGERVVGVEFEDRLNGGGVHTARASVTVNVAGPWVDRVLGGSGAVSVETGQNGAIAGAGWYKWEGDYGKLVQERDRQLADLLDWLRQNERVEALGAKGENKRLRERSR